MYRHYRLLIVLLTLVLPLSSMQSAASSETEEFIQRLSAIDEKGGAVYQISRLLPMRDTATKLGGSALFHFAGLLGETYFFDNKLSLARRYFEMAEMHATAENKKSYNYHSMLDSWAFSYWHEGKLTKARAMLDKFYKHIEVSGNKAALLKALNTQALFETTEGNWTIALQLGNRAMALIDSNELVFESNADKLNELGRTLTMVASLYYESDPEKARDLHARSLEMGYIINDEYIIETDLHHLAILNIKLGRLDTALKHINKLLDISHKVGRTTGLISAFTNLSQLRLHQKDTQKAYEAILRVKQLVNQDTIPPLREYYVLQAARVYHAQEKYNKALDLLEKNNALFSRSNAQGSRRLPFLDLLAATHFKLGNAKEALAVQARFQTLIKKLHSKGYTGYKPYQLSGL